MNERMHNEKLEDVHIDIIIVSGMVVYDVVSAYPWDKELSIHSSKASLHMFTGNDTETCKVHD